MMRWYDDGWTSGYGAAMVVMVLVTVALVGLAVWAGVRLFGRHDVAASAAPTARAVLDRRLAAGEIDAEQYAQLRRLLADQGSGPVTGGPGVAHR